MSDKSHCVECQTTAEHTCADYAVCLCGCVSWADRLEAWIGIATNAVMVVAPPLTALIEGLRG